MITDFKIPLVECRKEILKIYNSNFNVDYKEDESPLTLADTRTNEIICNFLRNKFEYPILSEENKIPSFNERKKWNRFWIIDPIDGTKEFVNKTDNFTVNIALIENGVPIFGLIYLPVQDILYFGEAFKFSLKVEDYSSNQFVSKFLPCERTKKITFAVSPSFLNKETLEYIESCSTDYDLVKIGSSVKFCFVAEGIADVYPRFGPSSEWDIAAGHAILLGVGRDIVDLNGKSISYNKEDLKNPNFIAK